jgi:glyoxylase-like metal-dependent hydrolase (beta-lactamase superfamily II)
VILTHLHCDHVGNPDKFPEATFVVQEEEMAFGPPAMRAGSTSGTVEIEDVIHLVRENFEAGYAS